MVLNLELVEITSSWKFTDRKHLQMSFADSIGFCIYLELEKLSDLCRVIFYRYDNSILRGAIEPQKLIYISFFNYNFKTTCFIVGNCDNHYLWKRNPVVQLFIYFLVFLKMYMKGCKLNHNSANPQHYYVETTCHFVLMLYHIFKHVRKPKKIGEGHREMYTLLNSILIFIDL